MYTTGIQVTTHSLSVAEISVFMYISSVIPVNENTNEEGTISAAPKPTRLRSAVATEAIRPGAAQGQRCIRRGIVRGRISSLLILYAGCFYMHGIQSHEFNASLSTVNELNEQPCLRQW
jgi:hypothetical protein